MDPFCISIVKVYPKHFLWNVITKPLVIHGSFVSNVNLCWKIHILHISCQHLSPTVQVMLHVIFLIDMEIMFLLRLMILWEDCWFSNFSRSNLNHSFIFSECYNKHWLNIAFNAPFDRMITVGLIRNSWFGLERKIRFSFQ